MTPLFGFTFGLSAVILGLALTHMAKCLHGLVLAGKRVRWAPEPLLLTAIIFLVIVSVWLFHWQDRMQSSTTIGLMLLQVLKLLLPFLAAAFVLPSSVPGEGRVDLLDHYHRTRPFTYGAMIAGLLLFWIYRLVQPGIDTSSTFGWSATLRSAPWLYVSLYGSLIFIRARWFNIIALSAGLAYYAWNIIPVTLEA